MTTPARALLELASLSLVFGAASLVQARTRGAPVALPGRAAAVFVVVALGAAARTAVVAAGLGEGLFLVLASATLAASISVPLFAVRPAWAWRAAVSAPAAWLVLVLVTRRLSP